MFAITYFLTLFMQDVLGYGPMKAGVAYLPFALVIVTVAAATSSFVGRFGIKVPLVVGTALGALGLFWFAQVTPTSSYAAGLLGPHAGHRRGRRHVLRATDPGGRVRGALR